MQCVGQVIKLYSGRPFPPLKTEDTGLIFEMAICLANRAEYNGNFKYDLEESKRLSHRLTWLKGYKHTASRGSRYDFTNEAGEHLSAKSTKKGVGKVAPQCVGQCSLQKFSEMFELNVTDIRREIQENILDILPVLEEYTFDCPILYYNKAKDEILHIHRVKPIEWDQFDRTFTCDYTKWKNSSTLKLNGVAVLEFQIHSRSRKNIVSRWFFSNLLSLAGHSFTIDAK